jgi:hypothetical protein
MAKNFKHDGNNPDPLKDLAGQVERYRLQAEELGRMQVGRPLLECPGCGLHEDELADLTVVVCREGAPGLDTGLRFLSQDEEDGTWLCPACFGLVRTRPEGLLPT